jgi:hypothetical protein
MWSVKRRKIGRIRKVKAGANAPRDVNPKPAFLGDLVTDIVSNDSEGVFGHTPARNEPDIIQGTAGPSGSTTEHGTSSLARVIGSQQPSDTPIKILQINAAKSQAVMHENRQIIGNAKNRHCAHTGTSD